MSKLIIPKIVQIIGVENTNQTQCSVLGLDDQGNTYAMNSSKGKPEWELIIKNKDARQGLNYPHHDNTHRRHKGDDG